MLSAAAFAASVVGAAVALTLLWALRRAMRIADGVGAIDNT
jgi:hypothetical protein